MGLKLNFSVMTHNADVSENLGALVSRLGKEKNLDITLHEMDYETGWSEFVRNSIYKGSLQLSEIGSTWINDFIAMSALRPYTPQELRQAGGAESFAPALWRVCLGEENRPYAIPWMMDLSLVCYRRSFLEKAGVELSSAFDTPAHFEQTLQKLHELGGISAWVAPTRKSHITIHNLAMWVWSTGKDFLDAQGKQITIAQPDVRQAIGSYFSLYRFIAPELRGLEETESDGAFINGRAAVTLSGPWLARSIAANPELAADLGLAVPLQNAYMGGSGLVVWKDSGRERELTDLVARLTSPEAGATLAKLAGLLPPRLDAGESFPLERPDLKDMVNQAVRCGKTLPNLGLWGMVEDRLVSGMALLWSELLSAPSAGLEAVVDKHIASLAHRINIVLENN